MQIHERNIILEVVSILMIDDEDDNQYSKKDNHEYTKNLNTYNKAIKEFYIRRAKKDKNYIKIAAIFFAFVVIPYLLIKDMLVFHTLI